MKYGIFVLSCVIAVVLVSVAWASFSYMDGHYQMVISGDEAYETASLIASASSINMELVGRLPFGPARAVYTVDKYAYLCAGGTMVILDVSDPAIPSEIGRIDTPGIAWGVHVVDSYAYVADRAEGLRVIDVSDPANPHEVGFYDTLWIAEGVYVVGSYAYVAASWEGLRVIDVSDPANPQEVGSYDTPDSACGIHVVGGYAYVTDDWRGLWVIDVSDPTNPQGVGFYDTPGVARGVHVVDSYAYVADDEAGLRVIDVSDPANPEEAGFYDTPTAYGVYMAGEHAYVAGSRGLYMVDVSDPANPQEVGFYDTPGSAQGVYVLADYAYIADLWEGLRVIDVSDAANPEEAGFYDTPGSAQEVYVVDGYAYIAELLEGLRVIDVSDPTNPQDIGSCDTPGSAQKVHVVGSYAYVADRLVGLRVIDVSDPANPGEAAFYDTPGDAQGIHVVGNYAYVADGPAGLRVIGVSDPTSPQEVGFYDTPGFARTVYVVGEYAYVADMGASLRVINVSDPTKPQEVGFCDIPGGAVGVHVVERYAYVVNFLGDFRVIDVFNPADPQEVGTHDTKGTPRQVYMADGYAYVATSYTGVRVIDVSDPASPQEVGFYNTPFAYGVYVAYGYVYVADSISGLCILRYTGSVPGQPDISFPASHHNFGEVPVGSNADWKVSISNVGSADLAVSSVTTGNPVFTIASPTFPQNIPPDGVLDVTVRFSPLAEVSYSSGLIIASNDPDESFVIVSLLGQGVAPESLSGELAEAMEGHGYSVEKDDSGVINQGGTSNPYTFSNIKTQGLAFGLNWPGSVLRLSVYRPDGVLYAQEQSDEPPLIIQVDQAEPGEWGYTVTGVDVPGDGYPYVVQVGVSDGIKVDLAAGWNLISLPLQPLDTSPEIVLFSINEICNSVWAYDPDTGWSMYAQGGPGDLEKMEAGRGYWIEMDESGTLMAQGIAPESTAIVLKGAAWNLTGYCALNSKEAEDCNLPDCVHSVWEYSADPQNTGWTVYAPGRPGDLVSMKPGFGYWIKVKADHPDDCVWDVNQPSQ